MSFVLRLTFENRRECPSCRDQLFFSRSRFLKSRLLQSRLGCVEIYENYSYFSIEIKKLSRCLVNLDKSRSRYLDLDGDVETKLRFLDCRDKLFETVEIFLIVETNFLTVSRSRVSIETPRLNPNPPNLTILINLTNLNSLTNLT
jgi:hypothetical protein